MPRSTAWIRRGREPDQVKVIGHKTIRSMDQTQADKSNDAAPLEISGDANNVVIRIRQDTGQRFERITATLEISVPKGSSIEFHGRTGDLDVNDIAGSVNDHFGQCRRASQEYRRRRRAWT